MADEPKFKDEVQGVCSGGDDVFYDSWAEANGKPPLSRGAFGHPRKKVIELMTGDQVLEWLLREYPDPPEDKDEPAAEADKPA